LLGLTELCFDSTSPATCPALFPTCPNGTAHWPSPTTIAISAFGRTTPLIAQALVVPARPTLMVPAYLPIARCLGGAVTPVFTRKLPSPAARDAAPVETEPRPVRFVRNCDQRLSARGISGGCPETGGGTPARHHGLVRFPARRARTANTSCLEWGRGSCRWFGARPAGRGVGPNARR